MLANSVLKAHIQVTDLVIASITAVTTLVKTITVTGANFVAGDGVQVTVRSATGMTNGIALYGVVIAATQLGIAFVNASAGAIDPADTFDFDIYVFSGTGNLQTGT